MQPLILKLVLLTKGEFLMKKFLCILLSVFLVFLISGCDNGTFNNSSDTNEKFGQAVTIIKLPSPPKCKTTNSNSVVNDVLHVLAEIQKTPIESDKINGGWNIMIKLKIDGKEFIYTVGNIFTDSDGRQYKVNNYNKIEEKLIKIYDELDEPEVDYP